MVGPTRANRIEDPKGKLYLGHAMLALSVRQPWAALLVTGLKSIEIRNWSTELRGAVLIHASTTPDSRAEAWAWLDPASAALTHFYGGIIGTAELTEVECYPDSASFESQNSKHLNYPEWFQPPLLYGFCFTKAKSLPFHPYKGGVKFFEVLDYP